MKRSKQFAAICTSILMAAAAVPAFPVQADETLPASFDLRTKGLVSKVQNQFGYETSWAFSALNSIETGEIANDPLIDLSEWHLAYYLYSNNFGYPYSTDSLFNASTYDAQQETGILTSWIGPVSEKNAETYGDLSITNSMLTMDEVREQAEYHVTDAINYAYNVDENIADDPVFRAQVNVLKSRIYDGNAIDVSFKYCDPCRNTETNAYVYNEAAASEGTSDVFWHSVSIVGWDDAFPASNFSTDPGMDGAWLCKNSKGVKEDNDGYFWLSYADPTMDDIYEIHAESAEAHDRLYQHDAFGNSGEFAADIENGDESVMAANVFTAETDGWMTSVMFCNVEYDTDAEFTIYTDLTDENNPVSGTAQTTTTAHIRDFGYHTIELDAPVRLVEGQKFAIVAKLSGTFSSARIPCEFATHTENTHADGSNEAFDSVFSMEMLERDFATGQSFYSTDGTYWYDMYNVEPRKTAYVTDAGIEAPTDTEVALPAENSETPAEDTEVALPAENDETPTEDTEVALPPETGVETTETTMRVGNICMKAVTVDAGKVNFSNYSENIAPGEKIELTSLDQAPIYYSLDAVTWHLYEEPIAIPEGETSMELSAYADMAIVGGNDNKRVYTNSYKTRTASISSLLCKDASETDYAHMDSDEPTALHYSVPAGTESLTIVPMTTGTVTVGDKTYTSGQPIEIALKDSAADVVLTVAEEGLDSTEYTLKVDVLGSDAQPEQPENPENPDDYLLGDVNEDGKVDAGDAAEILIAAAAVGAGEKSGLTATQENAADVNGDKVFNAGDAAVVLQYAAAIGAGEDVKLTDFVS